MKILKRLFLSLFLFLSFVALIAFFYLKSTSPQYKGNLSLAGLAEETEVWFDDCGIPHIYARNAEDAYYVLGYLQAQDRLFQMEMIRRLASGRMAELLGPDLVKTDRYFRTLGIREVAKKSAQTFLSDDNAPYKKHTFAYLAGLNEFIENGKTPLEFQLLGIPKETYEPIDIYTTLGYMCLGFSGALREEPFLTKIREELGDEYLEDWWFYEKMKKDSSLANQPANALDESLSFQGPEDFLEALALPLWYGSNGWVVAPEKSKSGKVIFANDTHIGFSQPSVWYEAHLEYPDFSFYGNHLPGVPFGVIGHNREVAWGLTIFPFDNLDLYREKLNPANPNQVWENDHWADMKLRKEVIKVKDAEAVTFEVKITRHGALMNEAKESIGNISEDPISLWWTFLQMPAGFLEACYTFNHAKGIDDARRAASMVDVIGLNVLYGDAAGNIAWWGSGKIPKRPAHVNPYYVLDGASGKDEPLGYYDFSENPHAENPPEGFVASANNDPGVFQEQYYSGYYCPDNRINRIRKHLSETEKWSLEDMKKIHNDVTSDTDADLAKFLVAELRKNKTFENQDLPEKALQILQTWNGNYDLEEVAPVIYTKLVYQVMSSAMLDELGAFNFKNVNNSFGFKTSIPALAKNEKGKWWDNLKTEKEIETRAQIFTDAFELTLEELVDQLGKDITDWQWQKVHTLTHVHPIGRQAPFDKVFNVGPFPVNGGNGVPNKLEYKTDASGLYKVFSGPALRILLDFNDLENSESIIPTGQSGNVMSAHYDDQAVRYVNGQYRKQMMNREEIENTGRKLTLVPNQ